MFQLGTIPPFLKAKIVISTPQITIGNFLQVFFISFISRTCGGESRLCLKENFVKKTTTTIITKLPVLHNFITYAWMRIINLLSISTYLNLANDFKGKNSWIENKAWTPKGDWTSRYTFQLLSAETPSFYDSNIFIFSEVLQRSWRN